jgi:hypothetical protein
MLDFFAESDIMRSDIDQFEETGQYGGEDKTLVDRDSGNIRRWILNEEYKGSGGTCRVRSVYGRLFRIAEGFRNDDRR